MLFALTAALWIDLSGIHRFHNGDSIVPVLVSLYHWTPFYWEQNRLGMLLPALALPFKDPMTNLLVQYGISSALFLLSWFLVARYVTTGRCAVVIGALSAALFLLFLPPKNQWEFLMEQHQYGTSLALGTAGLLLLERRHRHDGATRVGAVGPRSCAGAALVAVALWVNISIFFALAPLVLTRAVWHRACRQSLLPLGVLVVGLCISAWLSHIARYHDYYGVASLAGCVHCWVGLGQSEWEAHLSGGSLWAYVIPLGAGVLASYRGCQGFRGFWAWQPRGRGTATWRHLRRSLIVAAIPMAAAAGQFLFMGTLDAVNRHGANAKYIQASSMLVLLACVAFGVRQCLPLSPRRWHHRVALGLGLLILLVAAVRHGPASPQRVRQALAGRLGTCTDDILASGCTHVIGSYWTVWPAVFHANLVLHERGSSRIIWGISHRSRPTRDLWDTAQGQGWHLAAPLGDDEVNHWLAFYHLPAMDTERQLTTIRLLTPVAGGAACVAGDASRRPPAIAAAASLRLHD
jgi:hypothetical protein